MKDLYFRPLRADEVECRVAMVRPNGVSLLIYKDSRVDQNLLDEVVGPMNWQRHHSRDNRNCTVAIWDDEKAQWVEKEDTGTESNTEAEKGLASDSFKRACFNWGIGRELYTAPFIWVKNTDCTIVDGKKCNDRFRVKSITNAEDKSITGLVIVNATTGKEVFRKGGGRIDAAMFNSLKARCKEKDVDVKRVFEGFGLDVSHPSEMTTEQYTKAMLELSGMEIESA